MEVLSSSEGKWHKRVTMKVKRISVNGSPLYIDGHAPHFRSPKANPSGLNMKFDFSNRYETNSRLTQFPHWYCDKSAFHILGSHHIKTICRNVAHLLLSASHLLTDQTTCCSKMLKDCQKLTAISYNSLLMCCSPVFSEQFDLDKNQALTRASLNKRWVT